MAAVVVAHGIGKQSSGARCHHGGAFYGHPLRPWGSEYHLTAVEERRAIAGGLHTPGSA